MSDTIPIEELRADLKGVTFTIGRHEKQIDQFKADIAKLSHSLIGLRAVADYLESKIPKGPEPPKDG